LNPAYVNLLCNTKEKEDWGGGREEEKENEKVMPAPFFINFALKFKGLPDNLVEILLGYYTSMGQSSGYVINYEKMKTHKSAM
jgi:hypothetical protein